MAQSDVEQERQHRDPGDVGQDDVHREIAAQKKDAVAEAVGRGDRLGGDQEQPGGAERQPDRIDCAESKILVAPG